MSNNSVAAFCAIVDGDQSLQKQLQEAIQRGQGLELFVELAGKQGHAVTMESARDCFTAERQRRDATESEEHAETVVVHSKHSSLLDEDEPDPGRAGFRRVALSGNWQIGVPDQNHEHDSIHD